MAYVGRKSATATLTSADIADSTILIQDLADEVGIESTHHKVPAHADDSARDSAIPSPATGMLIYNTNSGAVQQYNGVWSTIAPAPNITAVSGFLNDDSDSTITVFGTNFTASSAVKMFSASSGGSQIGSNATTTFNSSSKLTSVFGAGSIGASGSTAYIEVDNVGATSRFATAITVNADPTVVHAGATGTSANTTTHLGTYGGSTAGGGADSNTVLLLNFDRADGSTDFEDSSNTSRNGYKVTASGDAHIETDQYKFGTAAGKVNNSSAHFDGTGDYLTVGTGNGPFDIWSVEWWMYPTRTDTAYIFDFRATGRTSNVRCRQVVNGAGVKIVFGEGSSDSHITFDDTVIPLNAWTHVVVTQSAGSGSTLRGYFNGYYQGVGTATSHFNAGGGAMNIGKYYDSVSTLYQGYIDSFKWGATAYSTSTTASTWGAFSEPTALYGVSLSQTLPTITFTGTATQLAGDEDIEFTSVANTTKAANNQHLTDSGIGLTLTNLTGGDKNKATLTGTIASDGGTTHTNMPMKVQVRKTLATAAYADASRVVTFSGSETTAGLAPAMPVTGTGIPASTTITTVDTATTITLSANPTGGTLTGQSLVFLDLNRVAHVNGAEVLATGDSMLTIATGTAGADPVLFNARRYMGNTTGLRQITGFGFRPDLVWIKDRNTAGSHGLFDIVRGTNNSLSSDATGQEDTGANYLSAFGSDGFTLGQSGTGNANVANHLNGDNHTFIAWGWKAGEGVTTSGTTSGGGTDTAFTRSVNTAGGFSIIKYVGNGTDGHNIPHGLTAAPNFVLVKNRNTTNDWIVFHSSTGSNGTTYRGILSGTATFIADGGSYWSNDFPDATNVTLGSLAHINGNTNNLIMHAWHAVAGVSAFGSYTGNAGANTITYTGSNSFTARWIIIKKISATGNWIMLDGFRESTAEWTTRIKANGNETESSDAGYGLTPSSTGFSFDAASTDADVNTSGTYIYAAFA